MLGVKERKKECGRHTKNFEIYLGRDLELRLPLERMRKLLPATL